MSSKLRTALNQAVEKVAKEFDSSYEQTKRDNESLRGTNCLLMRRIEQLKGRCEALQAEKDCSEDSSLKSKYDLLETRYDALQQMNKRLLHRAAQEKDENEVLHRKVHDLWNKLWQTYQERDELAGELKNKSVLDSVLAQKYQKQQIALQSDIGEAFECELDGKPFEKGYYLRISKEAYDLSKDARIFAHVTLMKHSDK